jgi:acyl carrier protein
MNSKEAIYQQLQTILHELFEIDPAAISASSNLYEDLDIDSIDAVDMAAQLHQLTGKKLEPADFRALQTVEDVVDKVYALVTAG